MTSVIEVKVSKDVCVWAIKESQKDFEEIKSRFKKIEACILDGDRHL